MSYEVKIDAFEGPIDLLLHLTEKNEMEIKEIKIAEITEQYLDYIATMQQLDLEVASEFLIMATRLMEIKVQALLPQETEEESSETDNPREKLVNQLLEYKKYKSLADQLQEFEIQQRQSYTRNVAPLLAELDFPDHNPLEEVAVDDFVDALESVLTDYQQRQQAAETKEEPESKLTHLRPEDITVEEQQQYIQQQIAADPNITFKDLFWGLNTRIEIIVTFMALLELIKQHQVKVAQENNFSQITIYRAEGGHYYEQSGS